jgi:hypothetical protein
MKTNFSQTAKRERREKFSFRVLLSARGVL